MTTAGLDEAEDAGNGAASPEVAGDANGEAERRRRRADGAADGRNRAPGRGRRFAPENGGGIEPELHAGVADLDTTPVVETEPPAMHASAESWSSESGARSLGDTESPSDVPPPAAAEPREEATGPAVAVPEAIHPIGAAAPALDRA